MFFQKSFRSAHLPPLLGVFELQDKNEELKHLRMGINRMAYRLDYAIDSYFYFCRTDYWSNIMCHSSVTWEIQFLRIGLIKSRHVYFYNTKVLDKNIHSQGFLSPEANNTIVYLRLGTLYELRCLPLRNHVSDVGKFF